MKSNQGWRGYISSRAIAGQVIPQRVQNLVIRSYAQKQNLLFLLSSTEYYMDNCYMMLDALTEELDALAGLIFYSLDLLPENHEKRQTLYQSILVRECQLHFALEEIVIACEADIGLVEDILECRQVLLETRNSLEPIDPEILLNPKP